MLMMKVTFKGGGKKRSFKLSMLSAQEHLKRKFFTLPQN